jgi:hypothetical protein
MPEPPVARRGRALRPGLLIADRQILALHGAQEGRGKSDAPDRVAARAVERFLRIYAPQKGAQS